MYIHDIGIHGYLQPAPLCAPSAAATFATRSSLQRGDKSARIVVVARNEDWAM